MMCDEEAVGPLEVYLELLVPTKLANRGHGSRPVVAKDAKRVNDPVLGEQVAARRDHRAVYPEHTFDMRRCVIAIEDHHDRARLLLGCGPGSNRYCLRRRVSNPELNPWVLVVVQLLNVDRDHLALPQQVEDAGVETREANSALTTLAAFCRQSSGC